MEKKLLDTGGEPVRVAIVDDHAMVLKGLEELVGNMEGYAVAFTLADARELDLAMPEEERPHVVLVDMFMPCMDGETTIRTVRQHWPNTRVLGLSFAREADVMHRALKAGACGFIPKNIRSGALFEALESVRCRGHYHDDDLLREHLEAGEPQLEKNLEADLSVRERQVLDCVCTDDEPTWEQVAARLDIEITTVDTHRVNVYRKLKVKSKPGLVSYGRLHGYGKGLYWKAGG